MGLYDLMHYNPNWCVHILYPVMPYRNQVVHISEAIGPRDGSLGTFL